jgi:hypothetical protein
VRLACFVPIALQRPKPVIFAMNHMFAISRDFAVDRFAIRSISLWLNATRRA